MENLVVGEPQQVRRIGERCQLLARGRIGVEPRFDFAPLRCLQFAVQIGDEAVVTEPLHPSYSCPLLGRLRAAPAVPCGPARDGS